MKENRTTAVLVQDQGAITGIFTSKDVVLRVIAPGLDPANCSVVRVMTPHPDFAPMDMTLQAALRKMHGKISEMLFYETPLTTFKMVTT
jgi:CBS domain-containing protein